MKKLVFSALACLAFAGSAFASNIEAIETNAINKEAVTVNKVTEEDDEDALHCKVTKPDGTIVECWVCDCKGLQDGASTGGNTNQGNNQNQSGVGMKP